MAQAADLSLSSPGLRLQKHVRCDDTSTLFCYALIGCFAVREQTRPRPIDRRRFPFLTSAKSRTWTSRLQIADDWHQVSFSKLTTSRIWQPWTTYSQISHPSRNVANACSSLILRFLSLIFHHIIQVQNLTFRRGPNGRGSAEIKSDKVNKRTRQSHVSWSTLWRGSLLLSTLPRTLSTNNSSVSPFALSVWSRGSCKS